MRKIQEFKNGAQVAKVYKNAETGEYVTRFFNDGAYLVDADAFTEDKADALGTARAEVMRQWGDVAPLGDTVDGFPVSLLSDIVDTARDGADWANVVTLGRDKATGTETAVQFTDTEDPTVSEVLTLEKLAGALRKVEQNPAMLREDISATILEAIKEKDFCNIDAEGADCLVQIALFGDVVYC